MINPIESSSALMLKNIISESLTVLEGGNNEEK